MRRHLFAVSVLAGILIPASVAPAAEPNQPPRGIGSIGIRLVAEPAASFNDPLGRTYIVDRPSPGTTIRRRVEIVNTTHSTAVVAVYPAAAGLRRGNFAFASGHSPNELSRWTSVSRGVLRLAAGARAFETVTIKVPRTASSGERYAVVWAEVSAVAPAAGGVRLVNRVGVRMYLSVGPGGGPSPNFAIGPPSAERSATGELLVVATVRNSGGHTLGLGGTLTLSEGPGGLRAGPFAVTLGANLVPGASEPMTVRLDRRLPRGPWRALVRLSSGPLERTAVATITFPASSPIAKVGVDGFRYLILAFVIVLEALAVALLVFLLLRPRRRVPPAATA